MNYLLSYLTWPPFIVWAVLAIVALLIRRPSSGFFMTVVSILLAMFVMFLVIFPDCFPSATATCPTDTERNIMFYSIGLGTLISNVLMWIRIGRKRRSTAPEMAEEREDREEPDFGQFMIYALVAVAAIATFPLGFWLLGILSGMQR